MRFGSHGCLCFLLISSLVIWNLLYNFESFGFKLWYCDFAVFPYVLLLLTFYSSPQYSEIEHDGCILFNDIPSGHNSGFKVSLFLKFGVETNTSLKKKLVTPEISNSRSTHTCQREKNLNLQMVRGSCLELLMF